MIRTSWIKKIAPLALAAAPAVIPTGVQAAGVLKDAATGTNFQIRSHEVQVTITNGFAVTEVDQVFFNPGASPAEAIYIAPLPREAALSEFQVRMEDRELNGEVVKKAEAEVIYNEEKAAGREAGLGTKEGFEAFQFNVSRVPPGRETKVHYLYYQPITLDTGVGRYVYPLEQGADENGSSGFWSGQSTVNGAFRLTARIDSAFPIDAVRAPNLAAANIQQSAPGSWTVDFPNPNGQSLTQDLIIYYRLAEGAPGRLEVVPFRDSAVGEGTFMATLTPGIDLAPLSGGADWTFLIDTSGSMAANLTTVIAGLEQAVRGLNPADRFRIVAFNARAQELFAMSAATPDQVNRAIDLARRLGTGGSTNLFDALDAAFKDLDPARTTGVVLITDGVANAGSLSHRDFQSLLRARDARVFAIVIGGGANWPLMDFVARESAGFSLAVSNADDISGRLIQAREKLTHEALRDLKIEIEGLAVRDLTPEEPATLHHGQQLVFFGHYLQPGSGVFRVTGNIAGRPVNFEVPVELPSLDTSNPEIERLWALARGEELTGRIRLNGPDPELEEAIADIGQRFSIVNDFTAMIALDDARLAERNIARDNQARSAADKAARDTRAGQSPANFTQGGQAQVASADPTITAPGSGLGPRAPRVGGIGGGGAIDPFTGGLTLLTLGGAALARRKKNKK